MFSYMDPTPANDVISVVQAKHCAYFHPSFSCSLLSSLPTSLSRLPLQHYQFSPSLPLLCSRPPLSLGQETTVSSTWSASYLAVSALSCAAGVIVSIPIWSCLRTTLLQCWKYTCTQTLTYTQIPTNIHILVCTQTFTHIHKHTWLKTHTSQSPGYKVQVPSHELYHVLYHLPLCSPASFLPTVSVSCSAKVSK